MIKYPLGILLPNAILLLSTISSSAHGQPTAMMVTVLGFDEESVNVSEGNVAVVCATAMFVNNSQLPVIVNVNLTLSGQSMEAGTISTMTSDTRFQICP